MKRIQAEKNRETETNNNSIDPRARKQTNRFKNESCPQEAVKTMCVEPKWTKEKLNVHSEAVDLERTSSLKRHRKVRVLQDTLEETFKIKP